MIPSVSFRTLPTLGFALLALGAAPALRGQAPVQGTPYLQLSAPTPILDQHQAWEGNQQPHTLAVVERRKGGFRYWGYYGLNEGRGIGLAFSNDLVTWAKYDRNPLWRNARWPSVLDRADPDHPDRLFFAITRNYDTPSSHIVLASSDDGVHLKRLQLLVKPRRAPRNRNQNPNLFRDPVSKAFVLTYYSGNDTSHFELVARSAVRILDLAAAPDRTLLEETTILAAPTMLYVAPRGVYYLTTEICPRAGEGVEWQNKAFWAEKLEGPYLPVTNNPVQAGDRACLFQHVFDGAFYGFQSHRLQRDPIDRWAMEVIQAPLH